MIIIKIKPGLLLQAPHGLLDKRATTWLYSPITRLQRVMRQKLIRFSLFSFVLIFRRWPDNVQIKPNRKHKGLSTWLLWPVQHEWAICSCSWSCVQAVCVQSSCMDTATHSNLKGMKGQCMAPKCYQCVGHSTHVNESLMNCSLSCLGHRFLNALGPIWHCQRE